MKGEFILSLPEAHCERSLRAIFVNKRLVSAPGVKKTMDKVYLDVRAHRNISDRSRPSFFVNLSIDRSDMSIEKFFSRKRVEFNDELQVQMAVHKTVLEAFGHNVDGSRLPPPKMMEVMSRAPEAPSSKSTDDIAPVVKRLPPVAVVRKIVRN
jgi:DNA mismatch repair ATPase MutL